jgi:hypothetical protein
VLYGRNPCKGMRIKLVDTVSGGKMTHEGVREQVIWEVKGK